MAGSHLFGSSTDPNKASRPPGTGETDPVDAPTKEMEVTDPEEA
jgi:hypothetical protein